MSKRDLVVLPPGGALTLKQERAAASAGLTLIKVVLTELSSPLTEAQYFSAEISRYGREPIVDCDHQLARAIELHRRWLSKYAVAQSTERVLLPIVEPGAGPSERISQADAHMMLRYLFAAMGKKRDEEGAAKLAACCDIFSSLNDLIGGVMDWEPVPKHPVILALAVKDLMVRKIFEPAEMELREALTGASQRLRCLVRAINDWELACEHLDAIVFKRDRAAWDRAYAGVDGNVVRLMLDYEGILDEDDDELPPPPPRWLALKEIAKAMAEQTSLRMAACEVKPARKTQKPRR